MYHDAARTMSKKPSEKLIFDAGLTSLVMLDLLLVFVSRPNSNTNIVNPNKAYFASGEWVLF